MIKKSFEIIIPFFFLGLFVWFIYHNLTFTSEKVINAKYYGAMYPLLYWCESASINKIEVDTDQSVSEVIFKNFAHRRYDSYVNLNNVPEGTLKCLASEEYRTSLIDYPSFTKNIDDDGTEWIYQSDRILKMQEDEARSLLKNVINDHPKPDWLPIIDLGDDPLSLFSNNINDAKNLKDPLGILQNNE